MTNEKIFANETLTDAELDNISGGNIFESRALMRAVGIKVPRTTGWGVDEDEYKKSIGELNRLLKHEFNIEATFDMYEKNEYTITEKSSKRKMTHLEVMKMVRSHYPQPAD